MPESFEAFIEHLPPGRHVNDGEFEAAVGRPVQCSLDRDRIGSRLRARSMIVFTSSASGR